MKYCLLSLCLITLFLLAPKAIFACSCTVLGSFNVEQLRLESKRDKAIFSGEVLEIREDSVSLRTVKLKIQESWKGQPLGEINITTGSKFGCGYDFEVGKSYLVFANGSDSDDLRVSQCSSTSELKKAEALVQMLKKLSSEAVGQKPNLTGSVCDVKNAVIKEAKIRLKAEDGKIYEVSTGEDGTYQINVPAGVYAVEASANYFKAITMKNYRVDNSSPGQQNLNFSLEVGTIICTVTVTTEAPKVN